MTSPARAAARRQARHGDHDSFEDHPAALLPGDEERQTLHSPDGDPRKTGTVTAAVPIHRGDMMPRPEPPPNAKKSDEAGLLIATRDRGLVVARSDDDVARLLREEAGRRTSEGAP